MTKTTKKAIYLRNFAWLLSIWLVLMLGFSAFLLYGERTEARGRFTEDVYSNIYRRIDSDRLWLGEDFRLNNTLKSLSEFEFQTQNFCVAIYAPDKSLMYTSESTWIAGCYILDNGDSETQGNSVTIDYEPPVNEGYQSPDVVFLNPDKWFNEEEIAQLIYYTNYRDDTKKVGNLWTYSVMLEGWVDGSELIPQTISVHEVRLNNYAEDTMSGSSSTASIYFLETDAKNTKNLPVCSSAWLYPYNLSYQSPEDSKTLAAALDTERFEAGVERVLQMNTSVQIETTGLFSERYYIATPYHALIDGTKVDCDFWIAAAGESNFLSGIWKPLLAVWLICFFVFFGAAYVLSHQSWQTYCKRAALEQQRRDTTNAIAHDLKTPLAAISGYAENLMHEVHTEKRDYYAGRIFENVRRMDGILQEMLSLSRLDAGAQRLFPEAISLRALTEEAMQPYSDVLTEKNITLTIQGEGETMADRSLMLRALDNFFSNAVAYTPEGGKITIDISPNRWSICNTGAQIPEDQLKAIWQAYYKADTARSRPEGSGLGLSIVKAIMELHGFACGAENTDEGVRFWFEMPKTD